MRIVSEAGATVCFLVALSHMPLANVSAMRVGIISDTHIPVAPILFPEIKDALRGVDVILHAGDIGVVAKLKSSHTNDTLTTQDRPVVLQQINFPEPDIALAVRAASRSDEDKIGNGLTKLHEEDPTFQYTYDPELRQTIVRGLGELHLDVQMERLKRKYHVAVVTDPAGARFSYLVDTVPVAPVAASSVRAVIEGDDQALWIGTDAGLLLRYPLAGGGFQDFTDALHAAAGDAGGRVMAFERAGRGRLWVATTRGLLTLDTATRALRRIEPGDGTMPGLRSMDVARDGTLWLGGNGTGLFRYRPTLGLLEHVDAAGGPGNGLVHAVEIDAHGNVWFATSTGLGVHEPARRRTRRFQHGIEDPTSLAGDLVRTLHESADGSLWVGTHSGLSRARGHATGRIAFDHPLTLPFDERGMPIVYSIAESPAGTLWLGTDTGILRFEPDAGDGRGQVRRYGLSDGLQDVEFNGGAATVLEDGRVAMGGVNGLNLFDPASIGDAAYDAPLRLIGVRIGADASRDGTVLWQPDQVVVPGDADIIRLRVGALDYAAASPTRYRYRLRGLHEDWIDNGTRNEITYTGLPAGDYVLEVQASDRGGRWNPRGLALPVIVEPPAWLGTPSLLVYAFVALLLLAAIVGTWLRRRSRERGYFRQIREREERLKLALWASGEQFWDYDLVAEQLHWMRGDDAVGATPDIGTLTSTAGEEQIHPEDLEHVKERMREHLRGHQGLFLSEHRVRRPDGGWTWIRTRGRVVERDEEGRALRVAGTARDISISRRAERERRIASEVLRSMTEAVTVFDRDFRFVSVNPAFARMTGYQQSEVIGQPTDMLESFAAKGFHGTTTRDIASGAGMSPAALYVHHRSKEEMLYGISRAGHDRTLALVQEAAAGNAIGGAHGPGMLAAASDNADLLWRCAPAAWALGSR